jgi:hypothetical protein
MVFSLIVVLQFGENALSDAILAVTQLNSAVLRASCYAHEQPSPKILQEFAARFAVNVLSD